MKAIGEAEKAKTPTKKSPGIMSRFLGLGRALADSVSLIGGENEDDAHLRALKAFYKRYNPKKVEEAKKILNMFRGREDIMFETLRKKYDVDEETFERVVKGEEATSSKKKNATSPPIPPRPSEKVPSAKRKKNTSKVFIVPHGATLMGIALQQNCSVRTLRRLNPELKYQSQLSKGQRLLIPASSGKKQSKAKATPPKQSSKKEDDEELGKTPQKTSHVPVEFCALDSNVHGNLLVAPDFVMFEPAANDPSVKKDGILAYQFCIDIRDVLRIGVVSYMAEEEEDEEEDEDSNSSSDDRKENDDGGDDTETTKKGETTKKKETDVEEEEEDDVENDTSTISSSSHLFGGSFLQLFWSHRVVNESRRTSITERYVLFKVSRPAIPGLISAVQAWIQAAVRKKRDSKSRSMSINFTSDGGGMLRAISLENLFKSIDHNRSTSPIELMPMRPSDDGGDTQQQEEEKIDAVLPIDVEKKTQMERIRSCELIELKATFVDKTELLVDLDAVAQVDSELPPSLRGESWRLLYSLVRDGQSFSTFLAQVKQKGPTIVVVKSAYGDIFGGYASQSWIVRRRGFFGTGECFVFRIASAGKPDCAVYRWTGMNDDFMMCNQDSIAMGCGMNGKYEYASKMFKCFLDLHHNTIAFLQTRRLTLEHRVVFQPFQII